MRHLGSKTRGFTLLELIVVIGIIMMLVALLMPALKKARWQAEIVSCGSRMRQFYMGLQMYSYQYREYPVTHRRKINNPDPNYPGDPLLLQGEHAGFTGVGIRKLLTDGKYCHEKVMQCSSQPPAGTFPTTGLLNWSGNVDVPWYCWVGPSAIGGTVANFGHQSGLMWRAKFYADNTPMHPPFGPAPYDPTNQHFYGVSLKNKWMRPFATCPSLIMIFHSDFGAEPHENMPRTTPNDGGWHMLSESWLIRRRNVLYNDGHVKYLRLDSHPPSDGPMEGGF